MLPKSSVAITQGVVAEFSDWCRFPHGSGREGALAAYLTRRLSALGGQVQGDPSGNLLATFPASEGLEGAPPVIAQGHLDMVCAALPGSGYDPETTPVTPVVSDGVLSSDGRSSLGADNNLGNACLVYLLEQSVPHGPLGLLFTVGEEVGLLGAKAVDPRWLAGARYLMNTDGFHTGDVVVSSAGGRRETYTRPLHTVPRHGNAAFKIRLGGFLGGHSGYDIGKGRANALKLMTLFLGELRDILDYDLAQLDGGHAYNAIPMDCTAVLVLDRDMVPTLASSVSKLQRSLGTLYGTKDPGGAITLAEVMPPERVWSAPCRDGVIDLMALLYTGVYASHDGLDGQVSASSNLGRVWTEGGTLRVACFVRCALDFSEEIIAFQHLRAARLTGFQSRAEGYPGWPADPENRLAAHFCAAYHKVTGGKMRVSAVHVGLEPSVLGALNPELVMACAGPDILDPHSLAERANLETLPDYVRTLAEVWRIISKEGA